MLNLSHWYSYYWSHLNIIKHEFYKLPNKGHSLNKGQRLSYQSVRYLESWLYTVAYSNNTTFGISIVCDQCTEKLIGARPLSRGPSWKQSSLGLVWVWDQDYLTTNPGIKFSRGHFKLMGPLNVPYSPVPLGSDAHNFTQLPLQPFCADSWLKTHPLINKFSTVMALGQWSPIPQDCYLNPFVQRRKVAHPVSTKAFLQPSSEAAMLFAPFQCTHPPTSLCPTLSAGAE